jgi:type III pantothenate kinase
MPDPSPTAAPLLLLVDAGNSRTKIGLFEDAAIAAGTLPESRHEWIVDDAVPPRWSEVRERLADRGPSRVVLTGSNPRRVAELAATLPAGWPIPAALPSRSAFPIAIDVDAPDRVGIDRLLGAIAANRIREPGQPAVIVSSGTATTVDYLAADGRFCGGAILPGFELSARALHQYTALLPLIPLEVVLASAPEPVGRNTEAALRSGLYWGHVGAVRELLQRLLERSAREAGGPPLVILTGGGAPLLAPHLPEFVRVHPQLPLQGLALLMTGEAAVRRPATQPG